MTVEEVQAWYDANLSDPECSDVAEHLNLMRRYASGCLTIVEAGVYDGTTALAWMMGKPENLYCVDIERRAEVDRLEQAAKALGVFFSFVQEDSRRVYTWPCDILYIDTWHNAEQLSEELAHWHSSVRQFIMMHDTESHGDHGMFGGKGLWVAIGDFLKEHEEWRLNWHRENCLGLTCLTRIA